MTSFGPDYATVYDAIYADKDYEAEANGLARLLKSSGILPGARLLDLGCGTGRHMQELLRLGYQVVGVDTSPQMLKEAAERLGRAAQLASPDELASLPMVFDASFSIFDVMSYQVDSPSLHNFFGRLTSKVRPGGTVVADAWHLPGMILDPPSARSSDYRLPDGTHIVRRAEPETDWLTSVVDVAISISILSDGGSLVVAEEQHRMRGFTQFELELLAHRFGLTNISLFASLLDPRPLRVTDWHVCLVASKDQK